MSKLPPRYFKNTEKRPLKKEESLLPYRLGEKTSTEGTSTTTVEKEIAPETRQRREPAIYPEEGTKPPLTDSQKESWVPSRRELVLPTPSLAPELPLTADEIEEGLKKQITSSFRWLAEWCLRQINLFQNEETVLLEVILPKDNEIEVASAEQMFASMASLTKKRLVPFWGRKLGLSFEVVATRDRIRFLVVAPMDWKDYVEKQIHGSYPVAEISEVSEYEIFDKEGVVAFVQLSTNKKGQPYFPLRIYEDLNTDPLSSITSAMSKLKEGEAAVLQILIDPAGDKWRRRGQRFVQSAQAPADPNKPKVQIDPKIIEGVSEKITKLGFQTVIKLVTVAQDELTATSLLQNLVGSFEQFGLPHLASLTRSRIFLKKGFLRSFLYRSFPKFGSKTILNTAELATLYHFPNNEVQTPHIKWLLARKSEAPQELPKEGLYLGISIFRGVERKVYLKKDDRRRHMYVIGQTGTGKSEFLKFLAQQDIKAGAGVGFIDPHGDAVEDILAMIPKERVEDLIYFNPGDTHRPFGLNILEARDEEGKHMAINAFIALLYKLYDPQHTGIMGPRLERAIRNVMLTAMSEEGNTLVEVLRLLMDPTFAKEKLPLIEDPLVRRYWTDELAQTSDFHKSEVLGYFVSKFDRFVTDKLIRNMIGQGKSAFDFRELMDGQKILLVNLSKGRIGEENSNFLGLLLVPRILIAAMSRVDQPEEERRDFYLYVDEFQNFATPDFVQILSEARKYRLNLTVGNQFIGQIEDKIKDAIFGNVGSKVVFRVGLDDATYLEHQYEPTFSQADLSNNPIGSAYLRLLVDGQPTQPFSMKTDWPVMKAIPRDKELAEEIVELSRLKYGRDRDVVEAEIKQRARLE